MNFLKKNKLASLFQILSISIGFTTILFSFSYCKESESKTLSRLRTFVAKPNILPAEIKKVKEEITTLLLKKNLQVSKSLNKGKNKYLIDFSIDGTAMAWIHDSKLTVYQKDKKTQINVNSKQKIVNLALSSHADFILILTVSGKLCGIKLISVKEKKIVNAKLPEINCNEKPTIDNEGDNFYYFEDGNLNRLSLSENVEAQIDSKNLKTNLVPISLENKIKAKNLINAKLFNLKYKNKDLKRTIYLLHSELALILIGYAGHYDMFSYDLAKQKLTKHKIPLSSSELFLSPKFELNSKNNSNEGSTFSTSLVKTLSNTNHAKEEKRKIEQEKLNLENMDAFVYTGTAGKYELRPMFFNEEIKMGSRDKI